MRRNPFDDVEEVIERMSRGFGGGAGVTLGERVPVDVLDEDDAYVVTADLPGFAAEDIDVTLEGGVLRIDADRDTEAGSEETTEAGRRGDRYIYHERTLETVSRTVRLPEPVDEAGVTANHSNGVLTVELPKRDPDEGHRIDVE